MTQLEGCIQFWESTLSRDRYLMEPGTQALVESTIHHLKELQKLREEVKTRPKAKLPDNKAERIELVKATLITTGYKFEHPTLVLAGEDGWFAILTPHRKPHQAIVHFDGKDADFFATVPELIE